MWHSKKLTLSLLVLLFLGTACTRPVQDHPPTHTRFHRTGVLVVIDPGHGGNDAGTQSNTKHHYEEKNYTLKTALILQHYLEELGYETVMTRSTDVFIPLKERAKIANEKRAKVFVSVHYNSAPSGAAHGIEVFYYNSKTTPSRSKESKLLAGRVLSEVIANTGANSRGVKHGDFAVIRETKMPAILIEGGFLTNAEERAKLNKTNYLKKIAVGIAHGINDYFPNN